MIVLAASFYLSAVATVLMTWSPDLVVFLISIVIRSMGIILQWIYSSYLIQRLVDDKFSGRSFSFDNSMFNVANLIGILFFGFAIDDFGMTANQITFIASVLFGFVFLFVVDHIEVLITEKGSLECCGR